VNATGQGTTPGAHATGTLRFTCPYTDCQDTTYPAGTVFNGDSGMSVQMMIDAPVTVPGWSGHNVYVFAPAHVVQVGTMGNMSAVTTWHQYGDDNNSPPQRQLDIDNSTPFTGGTDPQTYKVVAQSDIDTAANALKASTSQSALADIKSQLQPNEHLVGNSQCSGDISADHAAGDKASEVMVTAKTICTATAST